MRRARGSHAVTPHFGLPSHPRAEPCTHLARHRLQRPLHGPRRRQHATGIILKSTDLVIAARSPRLCPCLCHRIGAAHERQQYPRQVIRWGGRSVGAHVRTQCLYTDTRQLNIPDHVFVSGS